MNQVWAVVALRVGAGGADIAGVGIAEEGDEVVFVGGFHGVELVGIAGARVFDLAQAGAVLLRLVEDGGGVFQRDSGTVADLFEMGCARFGFTDRREIEGDGAAGEAERVETGVDRVGLELELVDALGEFAEFRHGAAVDAQQALIVERLLCGRSLDHAPEYIVGAPGEAGGLVDERRVVRGGCRHRLGGDEPLRGGGDRLPAGVQAEFQRPARGRIRGGGVGGKLARQA